MSQLVNLYRVFVIAIAMFSVCFSSYVNAAYRDNFNLIVGKGKPEAYPNPAAVNEKVNFNFTVSLFSQNKRIEEVPAEVKTIEYTVTGCEHRLIVSVNPDIMVVSSDKKSAAVTMRYLLSNIISSAKFPQAGNHSLKLSVTITFVDGSVLSGSCSINMKVVVVATLTVYAKSPDKIIFLEDILLGIAIPKVPVTVMNDPKNPNHDFIGHSFWKCEVDQSLLSSQTHKDLSGHAYGYYPKKPMPSNLTALVTRPGELRNDDGHKFSASKSYPVTVDNAETVLDETKDILDPFPLVPFYNLLGKLADNCTAKCVSMCGVAGINAPDGKGRFGIIVNEEDSLGIGTVFKFPNPYHHAIQLRSAR
ncbi:MAG: hypothetical protein LBJ00_09050 [Planctomycetaceae bacterium]|jgi:hypothetical protein|nr:hypothetical protein [Planctomycetaceae bacterium]